MAEDKKTPVMCNVGKDCKNPATFDFIMAGLSKTWREGAKAYSGCDKCILAKQKEMNAVLLDGTK